MLPAPVADALRMWVDEHERVVPGLIERLYVVGSVATGDHRRTDRVLGRVSDA